MGRWIREGYAWGDGFVRAMHEGIGVCVFVCVCGRILAQRYECGGRFPACSFNLEVVPRR
jgi:hypothetical protein